MKKLVLISIAAICTLTAPAQTLYVPSGTSGVGTSTVAGNVGIGIANPAYTLDVNGPANSFKARFQGPDGYITIGPANSIFAHIYTDRPNFIFNQNVWSIPGGFSSYSSTDLMLQTNGTTRMTIAYATGNAGIGTASPTQKLDVVGRLKFRSDNSSSAGVWFTGNDGTESAFLGQTSTSSNDPLGIWHGGAWRLAVLNNGNVGIGTTNPGSYKLAVEGKIGAREVNVIVTNPWPDYVFEKNYKLTSLEEIKNYIDQNQHLPEVPSAKEVEKSGVNLGEMNALLLKKIEELTLYMIELKNENQQLKNRVEKLEK